MKKEVLFVCEGNVGRSQMAEGFYNFFRVLEAAVSGGVKDVAAKYNGVPTPEIQQVMSEKGIDVSEQKIKLVTEEMITNSQLVVILCDSTLCPDFLIHTTVPLVVETVTDPYQLDTHKTRVIRDEIEKIVLKLIEKRTNA